MLRGSLTRRLQLVGVGAVLALGGCTVREYHDDPPPRRYHREVVVEDRETVYVEEQPGETTCTEAPPELRVEYVNENRPGYHWIHGYWVWRGRWVWVGGHWHAIPRGHTVWVGGSWHRRGGTYVWVGGYWR